MKKYLLLAALCVLVATACSSEKEDKYSIEFDYDKAEVIEEDKNYETSYHNKQYYTIIKSDSGKELHSYGPTAIEAEVEMVNENLIKVSVGNSDNIKYNTCNYYDLENEKNSIPFIGAADQTDSKVAVIYDNYIEICDIFDESVETQVIDEFSNELSETPDAILSAEFSEDGSELTVKYCTGDAYEEVTETFKVK